MNLNRRNTKRKIGEKVYIQRESNFGKSVSLYEGVVVAPHPNWDDNYEVLYKVKLFDTIGSGKTRVGEQGTFSANWISSSIEDCLEEYEEMFGHIPMKLYISAIFWDE